MAFLAEAPGGNEIIDREPLVGASGRLFMHYFVNHFGYTRADCLLANTLHCNPPGNNYPVGALRKTAERNCHQYREALHDFNPDHFVLSMHPAVVLRTWSLLRVLQNDISKAWRLSSEGKRVIVLLGDKAKELVLPGIPGGISRWRGHHGPVRWADIKQRWEGERNGPHTA